MTSGKSDSSIDALESESIAGTVDSKLDSKGEVWLSAADICAMLKQTDWVNATDLIKNIEMSIVHRKGNAN